MSKFMKKYEGFSLIEILIVVALIIILATITIVAINPAKNFRDTRNAQRSADVAQILNAVTQYTSEQGNAIGDFGIITNCTTGTDPIGTDTVNGSIDLSSQLVEEYIVEIPMDPQPAGTAANTGYAICVTDAGRVEISAPNALVASEGAKVISVRR